MTSRNAGLRRRQAWLFPVLAGYFAAATGGAAAPLPEPKAAADASAPLPAGVIAQLGSSSFRAAGQLMGMQLSPDGRTLMTRSAALRLWDVESGRLKREIKLAPGQQWKNPLPDYCCDWSTDGKHLVVIESQTIVRLLDGLTLEDRLTLDKAAVGLARAVRFEADGKTLIVGREDTAAAFDVATGRLLRELPPRDAFYDPHPFRADPVRRGGVVRLQHATAEASIINTFDDGKFIQIITHGPNITGIDISGDRHRIVAGDGDGNVALWNPHTKTRTATWSALTSQVDYVSLSHDGSVVAVGGTAAQVGRSQAGNHVRIWKLSGREPGEVTASEWLPDDSHNALIVSLAFTADGRHLVSASNDNEVGIWNVKERQRVARLSKGYYASVSHRGNLLATHGSNDSSREVKLFDLAHPAQPKLRGTFTGHGPSALSPDGRRLATLKSPQSTVLCVWDTTTSELVREFDTSLFPTYELAWSPDGKWLAWGGVGAKVWDFETGRCALETKLASPYNLGFTADSRYLLTARGSGGFKPPPIMLWDHVEGTLVREFGTTERIMCFASTSDPQQMLTGCSDGSIRLWDVEEGLLLKTLTGHAAGAYALALSPDGKLLAGGAADSTIFLWDATALRP